MQYSKFEEHLRSSLYEIHEPMDLDAFVDANKVFRKKKKRRSLFLFLSIVGILLISFGFISDKVLDSTSIEIEETDVNKENSNEFAFNNDVKLKQGEDDVIKSIVTVIKRDEKTNLYKTIKRINKDDLDKNLGEQNSIGLINNEANNYSSDELPEKPNIEILENSRSFEINDLLPQNKVAELISKKQLFDFSITKEECYDFGRPDWTIDLGVEAGVFYPLKDFSAKSSNEIFESRSQNEKSLEGLRASVWARVSREDTPMYLRIGGAYSRIAEQLNLQYSVTRFDTTQGIISITQSQNGDTLTIIKGNIITETTIEKKVKKHYYLHSIDLPLAIGYELAFDKFRVGLEAGVEFNISLLSSGYIQSGTASITKAKDSGLFKQRIGLSYFANAYFLKPIFYNDAVFVSGGFKFNPSDISSNSNPNSQKYMSGGINVGYLHAF